MFLSKLPFLYYYKNAGIASYAEAFIPVQSDSQTSEWYSFFQIEIKLRVGLSSLENNENATRSYSKDELNDTFILHPHDKFPHSPAVLL